MTPGTHAQPGFDNYCQLQRKSGAAGEMGEEIMKSRGDMERKGGGKKNQGVRQGRTKCPVCLCVL